MERGLKGCALPFKVFPYYRHTYVLHTYSVIAQTVNDCQGHCFSIDERAYKATGQTFQYFINDTFCMNSDSVYTIQTYDIYICITSIDVTGVAYYKELFECCAIVNMGVAINNWKCFLWKNRIKHSFYIPLIQTEFYQFQIKYNEINIFPKSPDSVDDYWTHFFFAHRKRTPIKWTQATDKIFKKIKKKIKRNLFSWHTPMTNRIKTFTISKQ